jgi:hypothetical protein
MFDGNEREAISSLESTFSEVSHRNGWPDKQPSGGTWVPAENISDMWFQEYRGYNAVGFVSQKDNATYIAVVDWEPETGGYKAPRFLLPKADAKRLLEVVYTKILHLTPKEQEARFKKIVY